MVKLFPSRGNGLEIVFLWMETKIHGFLLPKCKNCWKTVKKHSKLTFLIIQIEINVIRSHRLLWRIDMIPGKCLDTLVMSWNHLENFFRTTQVHLSFHFGQFSVYFYWILHKILFKTLLNPSEHVKSTRSSRFREFRLIHLSYDPTVCFRRYARSQRCVGIPWSSSETV